MIPNSTEDENSRFPERSIHFFLTLGYGQSSRSGWLWTECLIICHHVGCTLMWSSHIKQAFIVLP